MSESTWVVIHYISIVVVIFCLGVILGAYLISRRDEKLFKNFADVLTNDQKNDIMNKTLNAKLQPNENKKDK